MKLLEIFQELTVNPQNAAELKGLILQLAVQGKLTKNWRDRHPELVSGSHAASALLEKIKAEKARLVKEGKIKKEKALPEITKDEIPYELPEGWIWCRFQELILEIKGGGTPSKSKPEFWDGEIPWASVKDLKGFKFLSETQDFISEAGLHNSSTNLIDRDSLIICTRMGLGKIAINTMPIAINQDLKAIVLAQDIDIHFIYNQYRTLSIVGSGMTVSGIKQDELLAFLFATPPLEEQKAIVEIVEQLFKEVEALEEQTKARVQLKEDFVTSALHQLNTANSSQSWSFLQPHFNEFFTEKSGVKKLRESILQLAVQGKLSENWRTDFFLSGQSNDKFNESLKEFIKSRRDKHKKKPKWLKAIEKEESKISIPKDWKLLRLGELCDLKQGFAFKGEFFSSEIGPYVLTTPGNFYEKGGFRDRPSKRKYYKGPANPEFILKPGELIIPMTEQAAGLLGSPAFIPNNGLLYLHNQRLAKMTFDERFVLPEFAFTFFNSSFFRDELARTCTGMKVRHTSPDRILFALFPSCSIAEQKFIIKKVNTLMALCDQLEQAIEEGETQIQQLMQSCLREVFEGY